MRPLGTVIGIVIGAALGLYLSFSFITMMSGKFDWDSPTALPVAVGTIALWAWIASIVPDFKKEHRRLFGMFQLFIGLSFLLIQLGESAGSGANHEAFVIKLIAALFFLAQGMENIRRKPRPAQDLH